MWKNNRYWLALKHHYDAALPDVFNQFRIGLGLFFLGLVAIYASYKMPGSLTQEIILLIGLIIVGIGFVVAMLAQIRMLIIRIINFIKDK